MKKLTFIIFLLTAAIGHAQLTPQQKLADFQYLASLYSKQYAPYEWKRTLFGTDLLKIGPWLDRVARSKDDLDFYEICVEYVASLNDTHDAFSLPSVFVASLGFTVDIYDGKVLIDSINRSLLPADKFPFIIGDELVWVDGKDVESLIAAFSKYAPQGNARSTRRVAAARIVTRPQSRMPHAPDVGESAMAVIRRQNGSEDTYEIPWIKTGAPVEVGPVPSPRAMRSEAAAREDAVPDYLTPWIEMQHSGVSEEFGVLGYGVRTPLFALPSGFVQRLGRSAADSFYSGTYQAEGYRIGYIRIPNYASLATQVLQQFESEIAFFEQNTDGLVVDQMRNNGGFICAGENIVARLVPYTFRATGFEYRATWTRVNTFFNFLNTARAQGADQWIIDLYESHFNAVYQAYLENRGRTGSLPACTPNLERQPATDRNEKVIAYTKPIMMLIDEFTTSTADSVTAMFQDAGRGILFGMRTNGAGGTNLAFSTGAYSEGSTGMTLGMMTRKGVSSSPNYPDSHYIENVGVRPDVEVDFMTRDNLLQRGRSFVEGFTNAVVEHIRRVRQ